MEIEEKIYKNIEIDLIRKNSICQYISNPLWVAYMEWEREMGGNILRSVSNKIKEEMT